VLSEKGVLTQTQLRRATHLARGQCFVQAAPNDRGQRFIGGLHRPLRIGPLLDAASIAISRHQRIRSLRRCSRTSHAHSDNEHSVTLRQRNTTCSSSPRRA
jgi:hypothetical protein